MAVRRLAAAAAVIAALVVTAPGQAEAANVCETLPAVAPTSKAEPYEDQLYDPERLAPLATGAGIRVAVIDSGVDATHPQLRGHVLAGRDILHGDATGRQDCVGHGTAVAGIIAAQPQPGVGMQGLAPGAQILPVRISEQEKIDGKTQGEGGSPAKFAQAIEWAAAPGGGHAQVINLSLVMTVDDPAVRSAVSDAIARGVVIVAAAGNDAEQGNPRPYPASYPGVIGVGAIGADGQRASFSQHGDYVDIMAAGKQLTVAARRAGQTTMEGTSFAAPFVAATAALILQRFGPLTPAQVTRRLVATADPAPGGGQSQDYGYGLLNPYRALTETLGPDQPPAAAPMVMHTQDPVAVAQAARRAHAQDMSLVAAAVGGGIVALVGLFAIVLRRGRRRGWRPASPADEIEPAVPAQRAPAPETLTPGRT
jgi:type VII secretion-associated serine protease mycosin